MNLPKSAVLADIDDGSSNYEIVNANMINRVGLVQSIEGLEFPEITVFNDYVAILICKRKSTIVLTGASTYSNVGIIVGVGKTCTNDFKLSQQVVMNAKGASITNLEELPDAYTTPDGLRSVKLVQERNIFYQAVGEEDAIIVGNDGVKYCKGVPLAKCSSSCSCS